MVTRHSAPNGYPPFVSRKSFPELAEFDQKRQLQLLHEAIKERGRRSFVPMLFFSLLFSMGVGFGNILPRSITVVPGSHWIGILVGMISAGIAAWLSSLLSVRCLRPFLNLKRVIGSGPPIVG